MDKLQAKALVKNLAQDGFFRQNPTFKLVLGTCPVLAVSTAAANGLGMGLAVTFILACSNILISLLRRVIPDSVRIPAFVLIIATFVTLTRMVLEKFIPFLYTSLGVFLPLIVVNCIILGRAEAFASKQPVGAAALDGLFTGLGFTVSLTLISIVREVLGAGALFGATLWNFQIAFFTAPAGAFFVYGSFIALFNGIYTHFEKKLHRVNFEKSVEEEKQAKEIAALQAESQARNISRNALTEE